MKSPDLLCYIRVISVYKTRRGLGRHTLGWSREHITGKGNLGSSGTASDREDARRCQGAGALILLSSSKSLYTFQSEKLFILALDNWAGRKIGTALKNYSCGDEAAKIKICLGKAENIFLQIGLSNSN